MRGRCAKCPRRTNKGFTECARCRYAWDAARHYRPAADEDISEEEIERRFDAAKAAIRQRWSVEA